ncbi:alpha/beta hydrolase family protein [Rhizobium mesosinicum]|uniref:Lipoprotein signal peptide n=1 Tax=Rhizobium mesosinicum TaxID=335017 RepID=A0ABS7GYR7_9HYPH|nr:lipoprotein signal peptide [Rhizobium mesosinicum]MBW9055147.1 lipoprotein signal peptide [Rhizobium mesosinicum]
MQRLAFLLFLVLLASAAQAGTGFRETTLSGTNVDRPMHVSIWYPTASDATPVLLGETPAFIGQPVIKNAEPVAGPHPLVVLSHGYGGSWRNLAWLAAALVDAGYVVAAPDHPGTTTFDMRKPDAVELWKRPGDLSHAIDALLDNPDLTGGVASDRIDAIGHSLGGWTVVELAGGRFDAAKVTENCLAEFSPIYCKIFEALGIGRDAASNAAMAADLGDARIRAVVTLDLGPGRGLTPASLAAIHIPVMVLAAAADVDADTATKADIAASNTDSGYVARYLPLVTTTYNLVPGSLHFSFMQPCKPGAAQLIEKEAPGESIVCRDGMGADREVIHRQVASMVTDFLGKALPRQ